jgi:hypothetical protein
MRSSVRSKRFHRVSFPTPSEFVLVIRITSEDETHTSVYTFNIHREVGSCAVTPLDTGATMNTCASLIADGAICSIACVGGYRLVGALSICTVGSLTATQTCQPNPCVVSTPPNGKIGDCGDGTITHGTTCQIECNSQYELIGSAGVTTTCTTGVLSSNLSCVSTNNSLSTFLLPTAINFTFDRAITWYQLIELPYSTRSIVASATVDYPMAQLVWWMKEIASLPDYPATRSLQLAVRAESGATRVYTFNVRRQPSTRVLALDIAPATVQLDIASATVQLTPPFVVDSGQLTYALNVPFGTSSIVLTPTVDSNATFALTWSPTSAAATLPTLPDFHEQSDDFPNPDSLCDFVTRPRQSAD